MDQELKEKKSGSKVAILLLVLGIIIIGGGLYFYFFKNDNNVFETYITKSADYLEKNVVNTLDSEGKIGLSFNLNTNDEELKDTVNLLNKIKIDSSYQVDFTNKKMYIGLDSTYDNKELLKGSLYLENSYLYFNLNNITDKYYKSDKIDEYDKLFSTNTNTTDLKKSIDSYKNILLNNLDKATIEKENVTLNNKKVLKTTLIVTEEFNKSIQDELLKNKDLINSLSKLENVDTSEIETKLKEGNLVGSKVIIYTSGSNFVRLETIEGNNVTTIDKENDTYKIEIKENDNQPVKVDVTVKNNDISLVIYLSDDNLTGSLSLSFSKNKLDKLTSVDIKDASNFSDIDEEEMHAIFEKIGKNEGVSALITEINKLFGLSE